MKSTILVLLSLALTPLARAENKSFDGFSRLVKDAQAVAAALHAGGITPDGENCTFLASLDDKTHNIPVLGMTPLVNGLLRGSHLAIASDLDDTLLDSYDIQTDEGPISRVYHAFGNPFLALRISPAGEYLGVEIYDEAGGFDCESGR